MVKIILESITTEECYLNYRYPLNIEDYDKDLVIKL